MCIFTQFSTEFSIPIILRSPVFCCLNFIKICVLRCSKLQIPCFLVTCTKHTTKRNVQTVNTWQLKQVSIRFGGHAEFVFIGFALLLCFYAFIQYFLYFEIHFHFHTVISVFWNFRHKNRVFCEILWINSIFFPNSVIFFSVFCIAENWGLYSTKNTHTI